MIRMNLLPLLLNEDINGKIDETPGVSLKYGEFDHVICIVRGVVCRVDGVV